MRNPIDIGELFTNLWEETGRGEPARALRTDQGPGKTGYADSRAGTPSDRTDQSGLESAECRERPHSPATACPP